MVIIKDAAVPHYSKYNGKIIFAVRVCPANTSIEPFTVYRRWDEFLDLSAKLAAVFPSASPDPNDPSAIFRRIPRLSRKVTLFPTSATHSSRRDELDLFVRHLVNLPKAVTSFPLVRDFFSVKMNGIDGRQPPSPTPSHSSQFETMRTAPQSAEGLSQSPVLAAKSPMQAQPSQHQQQPQVLKKKSSKQILQMSRTPEPSSIKSFRPTLAAKRSTPDLRRFIANTSKDHFPGSSEEELPLPKPVTATQYPALDKFSFPPRKAPVCPPSQLPATPGPKLSSSSPISPPSSRPSSRNGYISSVVASPHASMPSDAASMKTNSTVRPGRAGSTSRLASPMSFVSVLSDESGRSTPMQALAPPAIIGRTAASSKTSTGPAPSLRHFRSLQDIRNVLAPYPQLPMLDTSVQPTYTCTFGPSSAASTPPQTPQSSSSTSFTSSAHAQASQGMTRSRSDSKILLKTLPSLLEDEVVSPTSSPLTRTPSTGSSRQNAPASGAPAMSRSFSADSVTPGSYPARRPSLNSVRRMQHSLAMTPTSQHQASSSISSLASTDSGSSMSMSRSQASSAGLGLDFSSSSRESLDFSDHTSSTLNSPDSSLIINSPVTPISAASDKPDPFDKLFQWQQNDLLQNGLYGGSYTGNNVPPPLPFFPTPAAYDQMQASNQSRRNSAANRRRASSLHQPVLETIIGSPVLGSDLAELPPMVTLKVMTETTNFMLRIAKAASLREVKEKVGIKIKSSGLCLDDAFELAVLTGALSSSSSASTAKASKINESKASSPVDASQQQINLEDEADWLLAVSLASSKITLRVIA